MAVVVVDAARRQGGSPQYHGTFATTHCFRPADSADVKARQMRAHARITLPCKLLQMRQRIEI